MRLSEDCLWLRNGDAVKIEGPQELNVPFEPAGVSLCVPGQNLRRESSAIDRIDTALAALPEAFS
jgi:hypothetical protein